ncbi:hypothetical protein CEXT_293421, partial [Caerostris extrusa]
FHVEGEGYYFGAIGCGLGVICSMILIFESRKFLSLLAQEVADEEQAFLDHIRRPILARIQEHSRYKNAGRSH